MIASIRTKVSGPPTPLGTQTCTWSRKPSTKRAMAAMNTGQARRPGARARRTSHGARNAKAMTSQKPMSVMLGLSPNGDFDRVDRHVEEGGQSGLRFGDRQSTNGVGRRYKSL